MSSLLVLSALFRWNPNPIWHIWRGRTWVFGSKRGAPRADLIRYRYGYAKKRLPYHPGNTCQQCYNTSINWTSQCYSALSPVERVDDDWAMVDCRETQIVIFFGPLSFVGCRFQLVLSVIPKNQDLPEWSSIFHSILCFVHNTYHTIPYGTIHMYHGERRRRKLVPHHAIIEDWRWWFFFVSWNGSPGARQKSDVTPGLHSRSEEWSSSHLFWFSVFDLDLFCLSTY